MAQWVKSLLCEHGVGVAVCIWIPSTYVKARHGRVCICNPSARRRRVTEACWSAILSKLGATGSVTILASTSKIGTNGQTADMGAWTAELHACATDPGTTGCACMHTHTYPKKTKGEKGRSHIE